MKFSISSISTILLVAGSASAQSSAEAVSTLTVVPHCASTTAADVIVTRSAVPVVACAAGNGTKPSIVSMPGYGVNATVPAMGSPTMSGTPAQFTGGVDKNAATHVGLFAAAGLVAALLG